MLEEIESAGDRLAAWVEANRLAVLAVGVGALVLAASYGGYAAWSGNRADAAADALADARREFMVAMGGDPGAIAAPEPANPEAAVRIRTESVQRFQRVAAEHAGSEAAALAAMEAGDLQEVLGEPRAASETWSRAIGDLSGGSALRALLWLRIAVAQEDLGDPQAAAEAYESAGRMQSYPLRYEALGDAARCFAAAGEPQRALELFEQIETEAPQLRLPDHVRQLLRELRATQAG